MTTANSSDLYKNLIKASAGKTTWPKGLWMAAEDVYAYSGTEPLSSTTLQVLGIKSVVCLQHGGCPPKLSAQLANDRIHLVEHALPKNGWIEAQGAPVVSAICSVKRPCLVYDESSAMRPAISCLAMSIIANKMAAGSKHGAPGPVETSTIAQITSNFFENWTLKMYAQHAISQGPDQMVGGSCFSVQLADHIPTSDLSSVANLGFKTYVVVTREVERDLVRPFSVTQPSTADATSAADLEVLGIKRIRIDIAKGSPPCDLIKKSLVNVTTPTLICVSGGDIAADLAQARSSCVVGSFKFDLSMHSMIADTGSFMESEGSKRGFIQPAGGKEDDVEAATVGEEKGTSWHQWARVIIGSIFMGTFFGVAMQSGQVTLPLVIRQQFLFQRFIMLKMFLSASGGGAGFLAILSVVCPEEFKNARKEFMGCGNGKGLVSISLGASLLGAGMALAGACPGMVLIQVGSGVENSGFTLLGGATASLLYGFAQPLIMPHLAVGVCKKVQVDDIQFFSRFPYWAMASALFIMMAIVCAIFEFFFPWETEIPMGFKPWSQAWPPLLSGVIIGFQQIPAVLLTKDTLGSTSAYMTVISQVLTPLPEATRKQFPHLNGFRTGPGNWWQVIYIATAILSAFAASKIQGTFGMAPGVPIAQGFIGGFIMLFGSRLASGCTSGHGLSGMALLAIQSIVAVPAMFAGGIITSFAFNAVDASFLTALTPGRGLIN